MVLTHAHLDHCGYLPRLVAGGFRGRIFCTPGTRDLCTLVLPDSAHIQEEDAREANRHGYSKHNPALPLYTSIDAARALTQLQPVGYDRPVPVGPGVERRVHQCRPPARVGVRARRVGGKTILFGGDLGRYGRPVLPDPSPVAEADILLLESTYGDRLHEPDDNGARLAEIVNETRAARRQDHHPVVRDRPRRGGALLAEAAGGGEAHPACCRCTSTARWRSARCSSTPRA